MNVRFTQLNIRDLIQNAYAAHAELYNRKNIVFTEESDPELMVFADPEMIKVVLRNLLSNALKFTNHGGKVQVKAYRDSENVVVDVTDSGIGMDEKTTSQVFSGNTSGSKGTDGEAGTGLGLVLSKSYAEKNNGKLTVRSEPGIGTTFTLILPAI